MKLAELKAQNEAEEKAKAATADVGEENQSDDNDVLDQDSDSGDPDSDDSADDSGSLGDTEDDNQDDDDEKDLEPWQRTKEKIPVAVFRDTRAKLKGRISEKDDEIQNLRAEIEKLKNKGGVSDNKTATQLPKIKRPREHEYDTDEEYEAALEEYEMKLIDRKYAMIEQQRHNENQQQQFSQRLSKAVDRHYERAEKLINESGIDPDVYKNSDLTVRKAIDNIRPNQGDLITDQLIDILGDGSEKVLYYMGRSKDALNQLVALMAEDPSGYRVAAYLGEQKARLLTPPKRTSNARPPATKIKGDASTNNSAKRLQKQYQEAHKKGDIQKAYNIKKEARQNKVDVSSW